MASAAAADVTPCCCFCAASLSACCIGMLSLTCTCKQGACFMPCWTHTQLFAYSSIVVLTLTSSHLLIRSSIIHLFILASVTSCSLGVRYVLSWAAPYTGSSCSSQCTMLLISIAKNLFQFQASIYSGNLNPELPEDSKMRLYIV